MKAERNLKKNEKKKKKVNTLVSADNEMSKLVILILVVALVFGLFYVITLFITKDNSENSNNDLENAEVLIQYDKILVGNILDQKDNEYYVLVYKEDDVYFDLYMSYLMTYSNLSDSLNYYSVNLDEVFNKKFISDDSKLDVKDVNELKFNQTTLLRVKNGKIVSHYEGKDAITGKLGRMTK